MFFCADLNTYTKNLYEKVSVKQYENKVKNFIFFDILNIVMVMKWLEKKKKNILKLILFIFMIYLFILLGTKSYDIEISDNIRFANEYKDISKNNIFIYTNENQVLEILNGKSGILFMGFSSNIWSHYYAEYLNEMGIQNGIKEIYYYDFYKDRQVNNKIYNQIVDKFKNYLPMKDSGYKELCAPIVTIVKNGEIIYFNNDICELKGDILPEDYFTDYQKNLVKNIFNTALQSYLGAENYGR